MLRELLADARDACDSSSPADDSDSDADADAAPVRLLPTTLSWSRLSGAALQIVEDGMAFLDAEKAQPPPWTAQPRGADPCIPKAAALHLCAPPRAGKRSGRASLDEAAVVEIFLAKYASDEARGVRSHLSTQLAREHGVTSKCVRDIWKMRTWQHVTLPYYNALAPRPPPKAGLPPLQGPLARISDRGVLDGHGLRVQLGL